VESSEIDLSDFHDNEDANAPANDPAPPGETGVFFYHF
jgi:hypothetical protein